MCLKSTSESFPSENSTASIPKYMIIWPKSRELKKLIILNLFIIIIVFTILSLRERELVYVFNIILIVDWIK